VNVLVIGGNRFFGKKLVRKLLENKHQVTLLNRQNLDDGFGTQVQRIKCDRKNREALSAAISNRTFDLAYDQVCYEAEDARIAIDVFTGKTSHYVLTSSQSVYQAGSNLTEDLFDPSSYKLTEDANSKTQYAEAKRQCEAIFFQQNKFPVTAVRFTFVVGEDDYTLRLKWHVDRVKSGEPIYFPNGDAKIPLIRSDDAAEVLFTLGTKRSVGAFNASSPHPIKLASLIHTIEQTVGKSAILTNEKSDSVHSPYGVESDWYMSIEKLKSAGVAPLEVSSWLPQLVSNLSRT
jgi:nucleoside-diphosphate-sugar epimerase